MTRHSSAVKFRNRFDLSSIYYQVTSNKQRAVNICDNELRPAIQTERPDSIQLAGIDQSDWLNKLMWLSIKKI